MEWWSQNSFCNLSAQIFNPPLYEVGMYESVNKYVNVFENDAAYFEKIALIFQKECANNIFRINLIIY